MTAIWLSFCVFRIVFCFRHAMCDRLRAVSCPSEMIDQIGGWVTAGVGVSYGGGYPLAALHDILKKLDSKAL